MPFMDLVLGVVLAQVVLLPPIPISEKIGLGRARKIYRFCPAGLSKSKWRPCIYYSLKIAHMFPQVYDAGVNHSY